MKKKQFNLWLNESTVDWIKSRAVNSHSCSTVVENLVDEKQFKSVTLEDIDAKLNNLIKAIQGATNEVKESRSTVR
jgi:hypothetical protein